jgi:hypothetical protein
MTATCYRCAALNLSPPGEPFGTCLHCNSFACRTCGVRAAKVCRFYCLSCKSGLTLLPSGGLPPTGGGGTGGSGGSGGSGGPPTAGPGGTGGAATPGAPYASTEEFEALEPELAGNTRGERSFYRRFIEHFLAAPSEYAFDEAKRQDTDRAIGYERYSDPVEEALRADLLSGAQRLARDIEAARAGGALRPDLLADAFGVSQWAIGIPAGEQVPPERLAMLPDERLRFVVGAAAVAAGGVVRVGAS